MMFAGSAAPFVSVNYMAANETGCPLCCRPAIALVRDFAQFLTASSDRFVRLLTGYNRAERLLTGVSGWHALFPLDSTTRTGGSNGNPSSSSSSSLYDDRVLGASELRAFSAMVRDVVTDKTPEFYKSRELPPAVQQQVTALVAKRLCIRETLQRPLERALLELRQANLAKEQLLAWKGRPVEESNSGHAKMLLEIWETLQPDSPPPPATAWSEIGFQNSPYSDFRGVGELGLRSIHFFCSRYRRRAYAAFAELNKLPQEKQFPFAITGLNICLWLCDMLETQQLEPFFYAGGEEDKAVERFCVLFSWATLEWFRHWRLANPATVMQFREVAADFRVRLQAAMLGLCANLEANEKSAWSLLSATGVWNELDLWIRGESSSSATSFAVAGH